MVCVESVFLFFLSSFFSYFLGIFWLTLTNHKMDGMGEGINVFLVFHFNPLTIIHLAYRDFCHFFLFDLLLITRLIADETSFIDAVKLKLLPLTFQSDIVRIWAHIKLQLQSERLNQLKLTPIATTVYLSHLRNPIHSHHYPLSVCQHL